MKKFFFITLTVALALFVAACSSSNGYTVTGSADGLSGVAYILNEDGQPVDSATVNSNGAFKITHEYEGPAYYSLRVENEGETVLASRFFVEPGVITLETHEVTMVAGPSAETQKRLMATATGTPSNDAYAAMDEHLSAIMREASDPDTSDERQDELEDEYDNYQKSLISENLDKYFGAYLLSQVSYYYSGQELLDAVNAFSEELQGSRILTKLRATAEQRVKTDIGEHYLEVAQNDPNGKEITLSSVVENKANKYVLLDFWASWCGPCMREVPYLVKTYTEFHKKGFEIYGVSFDTKAKNWTAAIKDKGLSWVHVSDLNRFENQAARDYSIQAIPSNVLINCADGTVIAKNLRGEDVYNTISELLK